MTVSIHIVQELKGKRQLRIAGLMSGTSMDGLDICVADIAFHGESVEFRTVATGSIPFPDPLREEIRHSLTGSAEKVCQTHYDLGRFYGEKTALFLDDSSVDRVDAIAMHGQTVHHISGAATLQIGEPSFLAETVGVPVVSDFRARDVSVGGTGAPIIPVVDKWIFQRRDESVICLNLGGIGNVTLLPPGESSEPVTGFDTGPGMALLDEAVRVLEGKKADLGGELASRGVPNEEILNSWMKDEFVNAVPPKSTGRDYFGSQWLRKQITDIEGWKSEDLLATLSLFTARTVAVNCRRFVNLDGVRTVVVSGGGVHHAHLMNMISREFSPMTVVSSGEFGVDPDMKEALGMAILGAAYFKGIPGNVPSVTGAEKAVVLGKLTV